MGRDLSRVRVHTGACEAASARAIDALAYAVGNHIVFGGGTYRPDTAGGRRLVAHELAHVVQQEGVSEALPANLPIAPAHTDLERAAERTADAVVASSANTSRRSTASPRDTSMPLRALHRQETTRDASPTAHDYYMLKLPPAVHQAPMTCWAAALSSWLEVIGAQKISFTDLIMRYAGSACIDTENALDYVHANDVFAEWGATFVYYEAKSTGKVTAADFNVLLRQHGHLLLAQRGSTVGHTLVVYGTGFDASGKPDPGYISVMDPITGTHGNRKVSGLPDHVAIGWATTRRVRPAPCLARPGEDPGQ